MKILISLLACFITITCAGQTKLISHRSHSGSNKNFRTTVENDLFDTGESNFGVVVRRQSRIDSVILKRNGITVIRRLETTHQGRKVESRFVKEFLGESTGHFLNTTNIDSLKVQLVKLYAGSKMDSTVYIGFKKKIK